MYLHNNTIPFLIKAVLNADVSAQDFNNYLVLAQKKIIYFLP